MFSPAGSSFRNICTITFCTEKIHILVPTDPRVSPKRGFGAIHRRMSDLLSLNISLANFGLSLATSETMSGHSLVVSNQLIWDLMSCEIKHELAMSWEMKSCEKWNQIGTTYFRRRDYDPFPYRNDNNDIDIKLYTLIKPRTFGEWAHNLMCML